ncbi:MAG: thioredoxin family protein [Actinomycetota bacterium]|nr:thioredoxin family protein [Actinomycetota bacterium]
MAELTEVDDETFQDFVSDGLVLVDIWSPDCEPCKELEPHVEEVAEEREELSKVGKLNAKDNKRWAMQQQIMGLPAFLLYQDGEEVARISEQGMEPEQFKEWLDEELEKVS